MGNQSSPPSSSASASTSPVRNISPTAAQLWKLLESQGTIRTPALLPHRHQKNNSSGPFSPETPTTPFNYGPVSSRDKVLYTCERAGNPSGHKDDPADEAHMAAWVAFMKERRVHRVLVLTDDHEFHNYQQCCPQGGLLQFYRDAGFDVCHQPMKAEGAGKRIMDYLEEARRAGEKVVAHCTGGVGRSGRVAAGWLVHAYGLSPEEATVEALEQAEYNGVKRKGDIAMLKEWLLASHMIQ